jgi:hypothetical protein
MKHLQKVINIYKSNLLYSLLKIKNGLVPARLQLIKNNYKKILAIAIILFFFFFPILVLAHGGDDHDDQDSVIPVAQSGNLNSKLAKTSQAEVLLKYSTPTKAVATQLRAFITDLNTNSPIENVKVSLSFSFLNVTSQHTPSNSYGIVYADVNPFEINAVASNIPGIYQATVTFPTAGNYSVKVKINGNNIDASAAISGIVVTEQVNEIISNDRKTLLLISSIVLLIAITISWIWYRRRVSRL